MLDSDGGGRGLGVQVRMKKVDAILRDKTRPRLEDATIS